MSTPTTKLVLELQNFGFSKKEAEVYIASLELGKGTVSQIARRAGINRTTAYDILAVLVARGVIMISGKEPRQEYVAEPPSSLTTYLRNEAEQLRDRIEYSETVAKDLELLRAVNNRPQIRFYEGKEGLQHVYEDTLSSTETIRAYASVEDVHATLPNYFPQYYKRRAKKDISIRGIFPYSEEAVALAARNEEEKRETVIVPAENYSFSPEINIYDDKVMIASWREKLGIIIESKEIADAMKKIYELAWIGAKKIEQENRT